MKLKNIKTITWLDLFLSGALTIVSIYGVFIPKTYRRDSLSMAAQGIGQDVVNLFVVVPILLILLYYVRRGKRAAALLLNGAVFYVLYSFFIYAFGVHFNGMFLWYCATLGLSLYLFILLSVNLVSNNVAVWFKHNVSVNRHRIFLFIIAALFYLIWLKSLLPALLNGTVPPEVRDNDLLVNPVHVLDIGIVLPGLILSARLLPKRSSIAIF